MATITNIASGDLITDSRSDINNNFANLNSDKIETSILSTDTTLAGDSDTDIVSEKAIKAYVDAGGNVNATETTKGIVEIATQAEVDAGIDTGATGATVAVIPSTLASKIATADTYAVGALSNSLVKTFYNTPLPFLTAEASGVEAWIGSDFTNDLWTTAGIFAYVKSTGSASLYISLEDVWTNAGALNFGTTTGTVILDWFATLPATGTGDIYMGLGAEAATTYTDALADSTNSRVGFGMEADGTLNAVVAKAGTGYTLTDISAGITTTNFNNYRIEMDFQTDVKFYVNGVLVHTDSDTANYPDSGSVYVGFGRSDTAIFRVSAPNLSIEM